MVIAANTGQRTELQTTIMSVRGRTCGFSMLDTIRVVALCSSELIDEAVVSGTTQCMGTAHVNDVPAEHTRPLQSNTSTDVATAPHTVVGGLCLARVSASSLACSGAVYGGISSATSAD